MRRFYLRLVMILGVLGLALLLGWDEIRLVTEELQAYSGEAESRERRHEQMLGLYGEIYNSTVDHLSQSAMACVAGDALPGPAAEAWPPLREKSRELMAFGAKHAPEELAHLGSAAGAYLEAGEAMLRACEGDGPPPDEIIERFMAARDRFGSRLSEAEDALFERQIELLEPTGGPRYHVAAGLLSAKRTLLVLQRGEGDLEATRKELKQVCQAALDEADRANDEAFTAFAEALRNFQAVTNRTDNGPNDWIGAYNDLVLKRPPISLRD